MKNTNVDTFIKFEDEHNLFDRHIGDFYYWHYIRYGIYKQIFGREMLPSRKADKPKPKDYMRMLYCALFRNTWFVTKHSSLTLGVYSRQFDNIDSDPKCVRFVQDAVLCGKINSKFLSRKEKVEMQREAEYIYALLSCFNSPPSTDAIYRDLSSEYCLRKAFLPKSKKILKKTTPHCILATPGYTVPAMVLFELALELNIPTVEIEHGFFTEEAVPQNFFRKQLIRSYPQYFFANSQYKPDNVRFPIDNDHVKVVGSPYLEKRVKNRKSQMIKGEIVLLDDNKYSDILLEFGEKLLEYIKESRLDYHITVKAHPANKCNTPAWERVKKCADITCITGIMGKNVYDCLEEAEIVVGICSSTLFEAQAYDCQVCVIKDDASKMMDKFVEQGYGTYVTNPADIFEKSGEENGKELWHPDALQCTLREIDMLIEQTKEKLNG